MNSSFRIVKGSRVRAGAAVTIQTAPQQPGVPAAQAGIPVDGPFAAEPAMESGPTSAETILALQAQAEAVLAEAQAHTQAARAASEVEAQQIYQDAHAAGYSAGHAEGMTAARAELQAKLQAVIQLADSAAEAKVKLIAQSESTIVELAIAVAKKVIDEQVEINPKIVAQIAARAIEQVTGADRLVVRVNPRDVEMLKEAWQAAVDNAPAGRTYEVVADRRVGAGGCIIETPFGSVDAQIDTQLNHIRTSFQGSSERDESQP